MFKKNHLPRWLKDVMYCLSDIITVILSVLIVLTVYHGFHFLHSEFFPQRFMLNILVLAFFTLILFLLGGIYRRYWKTATLMDFARLFFTNLFVLFPTIPLSVIFTRNLLPWNYVFWSVLLCSVGMTGYRLLIYIYNHAQTAALCKSGNNKKASAPTYDHIFLTGTAKVRCYGILSDGAMDAMSDHYPIYADVKI